MIKQYIYHFFFSLFYLQGYLDICLWGSDVLLCSEFVDILSIFVLYLYWIHYVLIYFFGNLFCSIQIYFAQYKRYTICLISFCKFSDVLPVFTSARAIGNRLSINIGVNIFSPCPFFSFIGKILLRKALIVSSRPS